MFFKFSSLSTLPLYYLNVHLQIQALYEFDLRKSLSPSWREDFGEEGSAYAQYQPRYLHN